MVHVSGVCPVKFLALADVHDNEQSFGHILKKFLKRVDGILLLGDIFEFNVKPFYAIFRKLKKPIIAITGNHDCVPSYEILARKLSNFYYIKNAVLQIRIKDEEISFLGINGVFSPKRSDSFHFNTKDLLSILKNILENELKIDIILSHECPYKCADRTTSGKIFRVGKRILYPVIEVCNPKIWLCGHTHKLMIENFNKKKQTSTLCMNPGFGFIGQGIMFEYPTLKVESIIAPFEYDFLGRWIQVRSFGVIRNIKRSLMRLMRESAKVVDHGN